MAPNDPGARRYAGHYRSSARTSVVLSRPDYYDGVKPVAANIDQIFVISSVLPSFTTQIIDRYIVACEAIDIEPIIVLNKADLLNQINTEERQFIEQRLSDYQAIGYRVLLVSSHTAKVWLNLTTC